MLPKLFFISLLSSLFLTHSCNSQCLDHQKSLLLQLKDELIFDSSRSTKLVQWNQTTNDCCKWYGVGCDDAGHVVSLQLDNESISGGIEDSSSSLFRLKYLQKLNLAYNDFNYVSIPRGIHYLTYLTHLNLSNAGFSGQVPPEISSLGRLASLDLSSDYWGVEPLKLKHPNLETLLLNMTGLGELYLDGVDISSRERRKWSHIISSCLPNITGLSLAYCSLSGPFAGSFSQLRFLSTLRLDLNDLSTSTLDLLANFSSLTSLSLANCNMSGSFPSMIIQIPTLQILDLSQNEQLTGSIPPFHWNGALESISLSHIKFSGSIPSSIGNLKALSEIDVSHCQFTGSIPSTFANLTRLTYVDLSNNFLTSSLPSTMFGGLSSLVHLDLGHNLFTGCMPYSLFGLPSLRKLLLHDTGFTGQVEGFDIANVSSIVSLDLSRNRLEGHIPDSFFQLQSLESLQLSENLFNGTFRLNKIRSLANLTLLDLSGNNLSVDIGNANSSSYRLHQLQELHLASCNIFDFPNFVQRSDLRALDLSNNRIHGEIPSWIWGSQLLELNLSFNLLTHLQRPYHIPASLQFLDLQSNQLEGELHLPVPPESSLWLLSFANNSLSGSIPNSLCNAADLDVLDLSVNKLSGAIPPCLLETIRVFDVGRNKISGRIPDTFLARSSGLQYFDINNNTIEGGIPKSLKRCNALEFMNVGNNIIDDSFPCMHSSILRVLVLHSNRFHGEVRCRRSWPELQILDISSNDFSGSLKSINFSGWRAMVLGSDAQLRHNETGSYTLWSTGVALVMKGLGMQIVKIWPEFNAVDLSCNDFRGEIPNAIGDLSSIHHLNISHNALNGSIPTSFGKLRELESLDLSRNQLTGHIPTELARLTFLSVLNVSYNKLVGEIPNGRQLQTFSADSFEGNPGLCGFNLNISCTRLTDDRSRENENVEEKGEIKWEYVSAAAGYVVGLGSFVWLLVFCRSFRYKYFGKIDEVVTAIFDARDGRRRRRARRRAVRNQVVRRSRM